MNKKTTGSFSSEIGMHREGRQISEEICATGDRKESKMY